MWNHRVIKGPFFFALHVMSTVPEPRTSGRAVAEPEPRNPEGSTCCCTCCSRHVVVEWHLACTPAHTSFLISTRGTRFQNRYKESFQIVNRASCSKSVHLRLLSASGMAPGWSSKAQLPLLRVRVIVTGRQATLIVDGIFRCRQLGTWCPRLCTTYA